MAMKEMIEIERRWLLIDSVNMEDLLQDGWNKFDITQIYLENLKNNKQTERIRIIRSNCQTVYTHTLKEPLKVGQLEQEEIISESKFTELVKRANLKHQTILKTRYAKVIDDLTYEVDQFIHPFAIRMLEVEVPSLEHTVSIPECLGRFLEVTGDKSISNFNLSLKPKIAKKNLTKYISDYLASEKKKLKSIV